MLSSVEPPIVDPLKYGALYNNIKPLNKGALVNVPKITSL